MTGPRPAGAIPGTVLVPPPAAREAPAGGRGAYPLVPPLTGRPRFLTQNVFFVFLNGERLHRGCGVTELLRNAVTDSGVTHRRSPFQVGGNSNCGPFRKAYGRGHVRAQGGVRRPVILES